MNVVVSGLRVGKGRTVRLGAVVTTYAVLLGDAMIEIEFERNLTLRTQVFLDFARFAARSHLQNRLRRVELRFVATVATDVFAGHADEPTAEELNGRAVFVDGQKRDGRVRGNLKESGAVLFDRNVAEQALNVPTALNADRFVSAGVQVREVIREDL